ncbi:MAG: hypothetical protein AAF483_21870, partial [Planctomycetota bacterium]
MLTTFNACFATLAIVLSGTLFGADPDPSLGVTTPNQKANLLATQALVAESQGDFLARQRLLAEAQHLNSSCRLASSHLGRIQAAEDWQSLDESLASVANKKVLDEYEQRREQLPDTALAHTSLANWCLRSGLKLQAKGHFEHLLTINTDDLNARAALGYRRVGGEWISPEQIQASFEKNQRFQASVAEYGKALITIRKQLGATEHWRSVARESLKQITDPAAAPAVEAILGSGGSEICLEMIAWFEQVNTIETTEALTRVALMHGDPNVRAVATKGLKKRPLHEFVPQVIEMTCSPVWSSLVPSFNTDGSL